MKLACQGCNGSVEMVCLKGGMTTDVEQALPGVVGSWSCVCTSAPALEEIYAPPPPPPSMLYCESVWALAVEVQIAASGLQRSSEILNVHLVHGVVCDDTEPVCGRDCHKRLLEPFELCGAILCEDVCVEPALAECGLGAYRGRQ
jgi:hypothetical protein